MPSVPLTVHEGGPSTVRVLEGSAGGIEGMAGVLKDTARAIEGMAAVEGHARSRLPSHYFRGGANALAITHTATWGTPTNNLPQQGLTL